MGTRERGTLPSDLARGRDRFQAWRQQRTGRGRIPNALWEVAVRLTKRHGLSRTATALGLDYHSLKRRAEAATGEASSNPPTFIQLPAPVPVGKQGLFELDDGAGATLRVHLMGFDAADLEALARSLWGTR